MFAELVPSFLTQLLRHGDLWWLGDTKITTPRPRAPDFRMEFFHLVLRFYRFSMSAMWDLVQIEIIFLGVRKLGDA